MASPQTSTDAQLPAAGVYRLDPARSTVTFTTRHLFGLGGVTGSFAIRSGDIVVAEPVEASTVDITVDAASFTTGHDKRDPHVRSKDFLHTAQHPVISYQGSDVHRAENGWTVDGTLTVRAARAPLRLDSTNVTVVEDGFTLTATAKVDRYAYGVIKRKGMAARYLTMTITAHATRV